MISTKTVTVVRIYTYERADILPVIMNYLQKEIHVRGVSIFRAVCGFGEPEREVLQLLIYHFPYPWLLNFLNFRKNKYQG